MDGASDPSNKKFDTIKKRAEENLLAAKDLATESCHPPNRNVRPMLLERTFLQTLSELQVPFAVCDCEADGEIASLANFLDCPVISNDSDFFIFDLKQGYIPLKYLDISKPQKIVKLFKREKLVEHLDISKDLLPLFASLVGNDFVSSETLASFHCALKRVQQTQQPIIRNHSHRLLRSVAYFLSESNTLADGLRDVMRTVPEQTRNDLRKALETSIETYAAAEQESELASYIEGGEVHSSLLSAPEHWVLTKFRQGLFPTACMDVLTVGTVFLKVQVENFSAVSANQCSLELRRFIYGVLRQDELESAKNRAEALVSASVKEWDRRKKKKLRCYPVEPYHHVEGYGELPRLSAIPGLDDDNRRRLCLVLLESNTNLVLELSDKLQRLSLPAELPLFVASLRYWIIHANPSTEEIHLRALLICCLQLTAKDESTREFVASQRKGRPSFNLAAQHSFAQWQSVMKEALHLNLLLREPLPTPKIRQLYDGLLVQELVSKLEEGQKTRELLPSMRAEFKTLYKAVTDGGIADKLGRAEQKPDRPSRKKVLSGNRFGALEEADA